MKKITICGSMHFFSEILKLKEELEDRGFEVHTPSKEGTDIDYSEMSHEEQIDVKQVFIDRHIERIKDSDAILVANYPKNGMENYIGGNTFLELAFAYILKKKIFLLNGIPDQSYRVEIEGLKPVVLNGVLDALCEDQPSNMAVES